MGGKKKYTNIFGSFTEPFNWMDALPDATRAKGANRQLMHESHHLNDKVTA